MRPRSSAVMLGVIATTLLVWLVVRSRLPLPTSHPTDSGVPTASPSSEILATRTPPPTDAPTAQTTPPGPTVSPSAQQRSAPTPTAVPSVAPGAVVPTVAGATPASSESASINAIKVRRMVTDYHTLTGENPVGTNAEIMAAVMGKNPRQAVLGPPDGLGLNSKGELVDEWGTPYFFHQLSRDVMEIHSAGPDKIMGTADDVVVR